MKSAETLADDDGDRQPPFVRGHSEHADELDHKQQCGRGNGQSLCYQSDETEVIVPRSLRQPGLTVFA